MKIFLLQDRFFCVAIQQAFHNQDDLCLVEKSLTIFIIVFFGTSGLFSVNS